MNFRIEKITLREWREGDKPRCSWASRPRRFHPPCGPPVAVVTVHDRHYTGIIEKRTYTVCARHRARIYDGDEKTAAEIYQLGSDAYLSKGVR